MDIISVVIQKQDELAESFRLVANIKDENGMESTLLIDEPDEATQEAIAVILNALIT